MDQLGAKSVVWASARGDIFWPGEVVEVTDAKTPTKHIVTIHFLIEDSYEDIKNPNKLFTWNCEKQHKFIGKGRALRNEQRKVIFNKAVAEADNLFMQQKNRETENNLGAKRKSRVGGSEACSPRKSPRKYMTNGSSEHLTANVKRVLEDQRSKIKDSDPSLQNNCVGGRHSVTKSDGAVTSKDNKTVKKDFENKEVDSSVNSDVKRRKPLQNESNTLTSAEKKCSKWKSSQDESKILRSAEKGSRRKSSQDESKILRSAEKGSRRKSSQDESKILTSAEKQGGTSNGLSTGCSHVMMPQRKRKLFVKDAEPKKKDASAKKPKPCGQGSIESHDLPSSKMLTNGHKDSVEKRESEICSENNVCSSTDGKENMAATGADCSVSSDATSDDELLSEPFSPTDSQETYQFSVDDIVWAKYFREPYWPALIKRITTAKRKSAKKILVRFLGCDVKCLFKIQPTKLVHFACDQSQRAEFLGVKDKLKGKELQEFFEQGLIEAEDLLNRKGLGKSLDGEMDEAGDLQIFEDDDENQDDAGIEEEAKEDIPQHLFECRKSLRAKKQVSKYSNILSYIRQAKSILKQILNGTKPSERHTTYTSGRVSEKDNLKHRAGFGPIAVEDQRDEIMGLLLEYYKEVKGSPDITYVSDVWLPEAIIWSIQQIDHVDRQKAEKMYLDGSKYAVTSAEVQELTAKLKQKKLSVEEAEERVRKAERAVERHNAAEN